MNVKTKEKVRKKRTISFTVKQVILAFAISISIFYLFLFYHFYVEKPSFAKERESEITSVIPAKEEVKFSAAKPIDLDSILAENKQNQQREEYVQEETVLEYLTTYRTNPNVPKGISYVIQEGRQGTQRITKKKIYQKEELLSEEQTGAVVLKAALSKVVEVGGGPAKKQIAVKTGDTIYVTSDRLSVMVEANESVEKIATLKEGDELKVLAISPNWYQISCGYVIGWVKQECTTNRKWEEEKKQEQTQSNTNSSSSGNSSSAGGTVGTLSRNMKLNQPSGFSLEQFQKKLTDSKDVNQIFANNAEYFYYVEKQYNINGIFVASVGIHESAWGTSKIAKDKKNLFGYGAYDANPYQGAYQFNEYSESIDLVSRVFVKYYLNPKGTSIYGGETAVGTYYSSPTLAGVNQKYATDKNWANRVYQIMQYLYNK